MARQHNSWTAHSRPGHTADGTHLGSHIRFYSHTTLCTSAGMDGMEEEFPEAMRGKNPGGHGGKSSRRDALVPEDGGLLHEDVGDGERVELRAGDRARARAPATCR